MRDPCIDVELELSLAHEATNDAGHAKMMTLGQVDILYVVVSWQNITGITFLEEINTTYIIILKKDILVLLLDKWLKKRADPRNKCQRLSSKKFKLFKCLLKHKV